MTHSSFQAMWQSMVILTIATVIGLGVNLLRHDRLPLIADGSAGGKRIAAAAADNLIIALEDAEVLYFDQGAVFLDARSTEQYRKGHIEGAKTLPWEDFARDFPQIMADIPRDVVVIVYCDGESCSLSRELAAALLAQGYDQVRVLVDGWRLWQQFNLPTER